MSLKIEYSKYFRKVLLLRILGNPHLTKRFYARVEMFVRDPHDPILKDHPLTGAKLGKRAFSITVDIRAVYSIVGKSLVFYDVGTHEQVY